MAAASLHFLVHDDHRISLAASARHADASIPIFLKKAPTAGDVDCAWWDFKQGAKSGALFYNQISNAASRGGMNSVDLMEATRNTVMARQVLPPKLDFSGSHKNKRENEERMTALLRTEIEKRRKKVTAATTHQGSSSATLPSKVSSNSSAQRTFEDRLLDGESEGEGAAASRQALDTIEKTLAKYRAERATAADNQHSSTDDAGHSPMAPANLSHTSGPPPHQTSYNPNNNTTMLTSKEMSGVSTELIPAPGRSDPSLSSTGLGGDTYYDPVSKTLQVVDRHQEQEDTTHRQQKSQKPSPHGHVDLPAQQGVLVGTMTATSSSLLDQLNENLVLQENAPHPLDVTDAAKREQSDLVLDALAERIDAVESRPCSPERRTMLRKIRQRIDNAMSLQAIQRHEQDTLRMTQCAALLEAKLYKSMLSKVEVAMDAASVRVEKQMKECFVRAQEPPKGVIAEQHLLGEVDRALMLAHEEGDQ